MKLKYVVVTLMLLVGLFTVTPYAIYGGSVQLYKGGGQQKPGAFDVESFSGSAAGGAERIYSAPDCRSCAITSQPVKFFPK